jgi:hypothetical protein
MLAVFDDGTWGLFAFFFIFIPLVLLWVFALADLFRRKAMSNVSRVIWLLVIVWLPVLGPITYMIVRPPASEVEYRF